jgi:hypothetical protein
MDKYSDSERLLRLTLISAKETKDAALVELCLGNLVMLCIENERMIEAQALYAELESITEDYGSASFMGSLVEMHVSVRDFKRAKQCLEKGWLRAKSSTDSINLYVSSAELYSGEGEGELAYRELLRGVTLQNSEAKQALQQPILTAQRDFLSEKLEFEAYKLQMEKRLRILYILLFSFIIVVVVYFLGRKLKKEKEKALKTIDELNREMLQRDKESRHKITTLLAELENKDKSTSASISDLRCELQKQEEDYHRYIQESEKLQYSLEERLSHKAVLVAELFKSRFASMSKLMLILIQNGKEETKNKKFRKEITLWHEKYFVGNKAFHEVERLVNLYNDDAMLHFRQEMQWSDEMDYRRTCCFFAGFSVRLIAVLMNETEDSVYQKRHRLRKFLETSDFLYKDLYLMLLSK